MKRLSLPYQLMFLSAAVLAVFYPTQFAEVSLIDDVDAIGSILGAERFSLRDIFVPRSAGGGYYRPLIGLSYWLDKHLWFLEPRQMHFEAVLFHLMNGLLLFFICREALRQLQGERHTYFPLAAAFLFSFHPIVTESVNWISGRTDIMMGNFVLLSAYLVLHYRRARSAHLLVLSIMAGLMAFLAKEAAFGWLPGFTLLLLYRPADAEAACTPIGEHSRREWQWFAVYFCCAFFAALFLRSFWIVIIFCFGYFCHCIVHLRLITDPGSQEIRRRLIFLVFTFPVAAILFYAMRRVAFTSDISKIGQTITLMESDLNYTISMFLGATGFYLKKFFIPLPLNFFIREIDPLYDFLGIGVVLAAIRISLSRGLPAIFSLAGLFLMMPALPFSFGTIAWTAYAERYIYLSTAFWIVAITLWIAGWVRLRLSHARIITWCTFALCLVAAGVTYSRNRTWLTNVNLMADTVAQNPNRRKLRDIYIYALLNAGRVDEAKQQYGISKTIHDTFYDDKADLIMGNQLRKEGRDREALDLYRDALKRSKFGSESLLKAAIGHLRHMESAGSFSAWEIPTFVSLERDYEGRLLRIERKPETLIEVGRRAMERGASAEASSLFDEALSKMSRANRLYPLAVRLKNETGRAIRSE